MSAGDDRHFKHYGSRETVGLIVDFTSSTFTTSLSVDAEAHDVKGHVPIPLFFCFWTLTLLLPASDECLASLNIGPFHRLGQCIRLAEVGDVLRAILRCSKCTFE